MFHLKIIIPHFYILLVVIVYFLSSNAQEKFCLKSQTQLIIGEQNNTVDFFRNPLIKTTIILSGIISSTVLVLRI